MYKSSVATCATSSMDIPIIAESSFGSVALKANLSFLLSPGSWPRMGRWSRWRLMAWPWMMSQMKILMWKMWRWTITSSCSPCPPNGDGLCSGLQGFTALMLKRSKNFEPSACHVKSVVVTVASIVTQKPVPVVRLGLNARWVYKFAWDGRPRVSGRWCGDQWTWEAALRLWVDSPWLATLPSSTALLHQGKKPSMTGFLSWGDSNDLSVFLTSEVISSSCQQMGEHGLIHLMSVADP